MELNFKLFVRFCTEEIEHRVKRTKSAAIELNESELKIILDTLVEDGHIIRKRSGSLPFDTVYKYNSSDLK